MNRLTSGTAALFGLLLVGGCHGDPTENLRGGVARLQAAPSTLVVSLTKNKTTQVTGVDEQGNPLDLAYDIKTVGPGISVKRDSTFLPVFLNDSTLSVPPTAPTFQFVVTGDALGPSTFTITSGGQDVTIPVVVQPDAANLPPVQVLQTGPSASDPTILGLTAPYQFAPGATVAFGDAGAAIVIDAAADGSTITILPPPGAASAGTVTGVTVSFLPQLSLTDTTNVPLAISPTVPSQPGTGSPTTAPDISGASAFYDGGAFTGTDLTGDGPSQYYKWVAPADGDVTFTVNWGNASDIDFFLCTDTACSAPDFGGGGATTAQPEVAVQTVTAGTTYYIGLALFAGAPPPWISMSIE